MIYEFPDRSEPIRQGDIFVGLPRIDVSLNNIVIIDEKEERLANWIDIVESNKPVNILVSARPVTAIVASQDCDALRAPDITLCEIREFADVERKCKETKSPKSWINIITQQARINLKWFYLPPDEKLGFKDKKAVDFMVTLRIARVELEELRNLRKGHLNEIAGEHFRERIGEFFRRYPYDEWYSLGKDELQAYIKDYSDIKPFPWQSQFVEENGSD